MGMRIVGGKVVPDGNSEVGAYVAAIYPGGVADQLHGELQEGEQLSSHLIISTDQRESKFQTLVTLQALVIFYFLFSINLETRNVNNIMLFFYFLTKYLTDNVLIMVEYIIY